MTLRRLASLPFSLLALPVVLSLVGCNSLQTIEILPAAGATVLTGVGQTAQFTAVGTGQMGTATPTTSNITNSVTWSVNNSSVATINASGLATAVGAGYTQVVAQSNGIVATSDLTVNIASGSATPSISVIPNTVTETFVGETTQFTATGNLTGGGTSQNLTSQVQWVSSNVQVATVSSGGLATAVGAGTTTITAQSGGIIGSAILTVSVNATAASSLTIIPSANATATFQGETTQFIAIGSLNGSGVLQNLTNNVVWSSSDVSLATIGQNGLATGVSAASGVTAITAIGTTTTGGVITATSILTVSASGGGVDLPTLSVYEVGTGSGTVTSLPIPITCGPTSTGTVCTGNFTKGATVTLTESPGSGSVFGGWSANCTVATPTTCTITMQDNETVGAIFN